MNLQNIVHHKIPDKTKILKKILYKSSDPEVKKVHVGFFPVKGRYFKREMKNRGDGCFELTVQLPKGKSFVHYFINEDYENPVNNDLSPVAMHDPQKRAPLVLETEVFCPVQFENNDCYISYITQDIWEIRAITYQNWIEEVTLSTEVAAYELERGFTIKNKTYWSKRIKINAEELNYCIKFSGKNQICYLHENYQILPEINSKLFYKFSGLSQLKEHSEKKEFQAGYQIFPDRFKRSGKTEADRALKEWNDEPGHYTFFGGDLKGILSELDYLESLNVDFIYLNPVFLSRNYHRYDSSDYLILDPLLGSEEDFRFFVDELHDRGIKLILDISPNHCSTDFFAFRDLLMFEENSAFINWFEIEGFPLYSEKGHHYSSWHGYKDLPQLNLHDNEVQNYFKEVIRYWVGTFNIDGWRLDVCSEMPESFVKFFTQETRKIKPEALIIAESWHQDKSIFSEDCNIDGLTNFSLYLDAFVPFFTQQNISVSMMISKILDIYYKNDFKTNRLSWNFLSNHDLPRFYSVIKNKNQYELAFVLLYALPGTPVIYYGEESKMEGLEDPTNRKCMVFKGKSTNKIKSILITLNKIRKTYHKLFSYGRLNFPMVNARSKAFLIERIFGNTKITFAFNLGDSSYQFTLENDSLIKLPSGAYTVYFENENGAIRLL